MKTKVNSLETVNKDKFIKNYYGRIRSGQDN